METRSEASNARGWSRARDWANTTHFIELVVTVALGLTMVEFRRRGRGRRQIAEARQLAIYLAHTQIGLPIREAGRMFRRERTTAAHACRIVEERRDNPAYDALVDMLERALAPWPTALTLDDD